MPRCYMVKKGFRERYENPPPCSPTEASVAPPCYTPEEPTRTGRRKERNGSTNIASFSRVLRSNSSLDWLKARTQSEGTQDTTKKKEEETPRNILEEVPKKKQEEPKKIQEEVTMKKLEETQQEYLKETAKKKLHQKLKKKLEERLKVNLKETQEETPEAQLEVTPEEILEEALEDIPEGREEEIIEVVDTLENISEEPSLEQSQTEIEEIVESPRQVEYAELSTCPLSERSAADTEAAHELLSLAAGVPPLPPAAVLTMVASEPPMMPVYAYALQPTNVYIIAEESPDPMYHSMQGLAPVPYHQMDYSSGNYIAYQEPMVATPVMTAPMMATPMVTTPVVANPMAAPPMEYRSIYREPEMHPVAMQMPMLDPLPVAMPVSVIESTPMPMPMAMPMQMQGEIHGPVNMPMSIQVPVIEAVPQIQYQVLPTPPPPEPICPLHHNLEEGETICIGRERVGKYDCNECGKRYATSSNLSRHKQTHRTDSHAKRCGECGKAYVSMPALAMHVLTHRMGHVCGVCGKQFSRPWLLRGHLRSHTGEKPYSCIACGKAFADRSNLRAHLMTHTADKKFKCQRCNKTFALKSYLNKHHEAMCDCDQADGVNGDDRAETDE